MSVWLLLFVMVWTPIMCVGCMLIGAYIMYCKNEQVNPLKTLQDNWFYRPQDNPKIKEDPPGFYD